MENKKKKMGRPPKPATEKCGRLVCAKVTDAEFRALRAEAKRLGISLSALLMRPWREEGKEKP